MVAEAYVVLARGLKVGRPHEVRYAAMAETPEEALRLVSELVSQETVLEMTNERLSPMMAYAIRLQRGHAKLI